MSKQFTQADPLKQLAVEQRKLILSEKKKLLLNLKNLKSLQQKQAMEIKQMEIEFGSDNSIYFLVTRIAERTEELEKCRKQLKGCKKQVPIPVPSLSERLSRKVKNIVSKDHPSHDTLPPETLSKQLVEKIEELQKELEGLNKQLRVAQKKRYELELKHTQERMSVKRGISLEQIPELIDTLKSMLERISILEGHIQKKSPIGALNWHIIQLFILPFLYEDLKRIH